MAKARLIFMNYMLSVREQEVAWLVCEGLQNKQIALELRISEKTVKTHVSNILKKLGKKTRLELILSYQNANKAELFC